MPTSRDPLAQWNVSRSGSAGRAGDWRDAFAKPATLHLVDLCLLLTIVAAPFFFAGRHPLGQLVLCGLAVATASAWCLHQWFRGDGKWRFTGTEPIILIGLALIVLQFQQLSPELIKTLSPRMPQLLPYWSADGQGTDWPGVWRRISFTPYETQGNLVVIVASLMFFFVLVQRLRTLEDIRLCLRALAVAGGLMAAFSIVQFLFGNGKFYWVYEHPMTDTRYAAKGGFTNANHFANYVAMILPAQLFVILDLLHQPQQNDSGRRRQIRGTTSLITPQLLFWLTCLGVTGAALLLSMSRGGIIFCLLGSCAMLAILWCKKALSPRFAMLLMGLGVVALGSTLLFGDLAAQMVEQNFLDIASGDANQMDQKNVRRRVWAANLAGIREFPIMGTGLGSHQQVYRQWFNHPHEGIEYSHGENGYLQIGLETGLAGLGIVSLLWLIALLWCAQGAWNATTPRAVGAIAAATAGLFVSIGHSLADFVWYVPACANVVLLYVVVAWRVSLMRFSEKAEPPEAPPRSGLMLGRLSWALALPAVAALGVWMFSLKTPELAAAPLWDEYLRLSRTDLRKSAGDELAAQTMIQRRLALATRAADLHPRSHRAQLHAGLACLRQFVRYQEEQDIHMPLNQIREAALVSFSTLEEMTQWLNRPGVIGEGQVYLRAALDHFRASLKACPLQPRPYLELAELVWIEGASPEEERRLIEQAVVSQPYDARARFARGRLLWSEDEPEEALKEWREAFRLDPEYRGTIVNVLSTFVPAAFFLDNFETDHLTLTQLREAYREGTDPEGYRHLLGALARASVTEAVGHDGLAAEKFWLQAHDCFAELGDRRSAYHAAQEALAVHPSSYKAHQTLGLWLYHNGAYREAAEHLAWCHRRKPHVDWLHTMASQALVEAERQSGHAPAPVAELPEGRLIR